MIIIISCLQICRNALLLTLDEEGENKCTNKSPLWIIPSMETQSDCVQALGQNLHVPKKAISLR